MKPSITGSVFIMKFAFVLFLNILSLVDLTASTAASAPHTEEIRLKIVRYLCDGNAFQFQQSDGVDSDEWHQSKAKEIRTATECLPPGKSTNFAMFRLRMVKPSGEIFTLFDYVDTIFASGGDTLFLKTLEQKPELSNKKIKCAADYWHSYPDRATDADLRKNIAEILGFKEALSSQSKDSVVEAFKRRVSSESYFGDMVLKPVALEKLASSCRASINWTTFDELSNVLAHQLRLVDKTKKAADDWHLNELFGGSFQLNFADSEQVIRQFICGVGLSAKDAGSKTEISFNFDASFLAKVQSYKKEFEKHKKEDDKLKILSTELDQQIAYAINSLNLSFQIEIASYNEMCRNCQATFLREFHDMRVIQQKCLLLVIADCGTMNPDLKWYVNGRLYKHDLAKKVRPIVSLVVSSQNNT